MDAGQSATSLLLLCTLEGNSVRFCSVGFMTVSVWGATLRSLVVVAAVGD